MPIPFEIAQALPHPLPAALLLAGLPAFGQAFDEYSGEYTFQRYCASCHGEDAHGTETLPRLAGQHMQYTVNQLKQFNKRERTNDNAVMHSIASKLSELETKAVAAYISGLK